jgi:uncharacterized membrane protein YuzA (DUF378 family)
MFLFRPASEEAESRMANLLKTGLWLVTHNPIKMLKAVLSFFLYALLLVVLPWALINWAQGNPQMAGMLDMARSTAGIDVISIATTIMVLGLLLSVAVLLKGLTDKWSALNLSCEVASTLLHLTILLVVLGAGDVASLGVISRTLEVPGPSQPSFALDMRPAAYAFIAIAGLNVILAFAKFYQARSERKRSIGGIVHNLLHL